MEQTRSAAHILKIQPAVSDPMEYFLSDSEDSKNFVMGRMGSVWTVHFQKEIKEPRTLHIGIFSRQPSAVMTSQHENEVTPMSDQIPTPTLAVHLKIIVVP